MERPPRIARSTVLFPVTELAREHEHFVAKKARFRKQGWDMSKADAEALRWIEDAIDGRADTQHALTIARSARRSAVARYRR